MVRLLVLALVGAAFWVALVIAERRAKQLYADAYAAEQCREWHLDAYCWTHAGVFATTALACGCR